MSILTISGKGAILIPKEIRERYGLKKGDKIQFVDYAGSISIIPVPQDSIKASRGMLKDGSSLTKALLESRREDAARGK